MKFYVTGKRDYDSGPYSVTFPANETSISFDVTIINDNVFESLETFDLIINYSLPHRIICHDICKAVVSIRNDEERKYVPHMGIKR